jgi:uncharacterized membrane-anchored protein YhcB (DUF1043 family)
VKRWEGAIQGLVVGLLMAILAAAFQTYVEVKLLQQEQIDTRKDLDQLRIDVNDALQGQK